MVWATKVLLEVTIIQVGNKAMGIMKLLREGLKIQKKGGENSESHQHFRFEQQN